MRVITSLAVPTTLAGGILLTLVGLAGLAYGLYAMVRGGRGESGGGLGPIPERGVHVVAGLRMLAGGAVTLVVGMLALWYYFFG